MSEFVGIEEGWVEKGWTRQQMRERIEELGLTVNDACTLTPYELNFMQNPFANTETLALVEKMSNADVDGVGDEYEFAKPAGTLWTPGETITVSFTGSSASQQESCKKYITQDIQPYVSMKFSFVASGGRINVNFMNMGGGGNSAVGKQGSSQTVNFSINAFRDSGTTFNWARYLTCHEFGHALGLVHEFDACRGNPCESDPYSVMNYPAGSGGGAGNAVPSAQCMDHYSPKDVVWLTKVYKGTGTTGKPSTDKTTKPTGKTTKPPGKTTKPPGKTTKNPPPSPPLLNKVKASQYVRLIPNE